MSLYLRNPLTDKGWDDLVATHPRASAFHQRGWIEALSRTYGYQPCVLSSTPECEALRDGIVLCRVASWITGTRLVSIPFADHCEPLLSDNGMLEEFQNWLNAECEERPCDYVEVRPLSSRPRDDKHGWYSSSTYWFHELDITQSLERLFRGLHRDCVQRRIVRAERARVTYESGCSEKLADEFFALMVITRKRHQFLPQPFTWFRNLIQYLGSCVQIRVARKDGNPIAALFSLRHRSSVVYKYGCSDEQYHHLGGMPFLFWQMIQECKASGVEGIDFGRCDLDNEGLAIFKERLGARREVLKYYRRWYGSGQPRLATLRPGWARGLVSYLPRPVLAAAGAVMYRHMG